MAKQKTDGDEGLTATVLNLQRMSTEDGPGIRTTVFFKGCSLSCAWCHNPESISPERQVVWNRVHCLCCGTCVALCPQEALVLKDNEIRRDRDRCTLCATCTEQCPTLAMEMLGKTWRLDALVAELLKDRAYFERSGGGVTLSGGDPTYQAEFARALLQRCRALGIHTALDTCGMCNPGVLQRLIEHTDLLLYDLKLINPEQHKRYTGASNRVILDNLLAAADQIRSSRPQARIWIRTPLIPGATALDGNIAGIAAFLVDRLDGLVERWELCAFNNLCTSKYERLGQQWMFADTPLPTAAELDHLHRVAIASGFDASRVAVTGLSRLERARKEQAKSTRRPDPDQPAAPR
ncbi:MAG: glycyl-radical enzyme activating protein [Bradymonadales bacterium]|nr:glycyl-radical enzyme activating protein [Bradymonadales bacterium]